jgi:phosphoglycolate phosphatase
MFTNLLFDLDGTLTDPKLGITSCVIHALRCMDVDPPHADTLTWCIGPPIHDNFARLLGTDDHAVLDRAVGFYRERFGTVGLFENTPYPGIHDALATLKARGYRLFVATSKPTVYAVRIVERFELSGYFERVHGSELSGHNMDKADLIRGILEAEGLSVRETVMIGDRRHDIVGAKANGVYAVGVTYGYGGVEELTEAGAHALCETPEEIIELLANVRARRGFA